MPFVAAALAALSRLFATRIGQWVLSALLFLGIGFATKEAVTDPIMGYLADGFNGLPGNFALWAAFLNVDKYCTIVASAYIGAAGKRIILRKLTGGT